MGANLRRIEAVTSFDALDYVAREEEEILETADVLKVQKFDISERVGTLMTKLKEMESAADAHEGSDLRRHGQLLVGAAGRCRLPATRR